MNLRKSHNITLSSTVLIGLGGIAFVLLWVFFMKEIPLSKHSKKNSNKYVAIVDDEDYEYLNQWNWYVVTGSKTLYAARNVSLGNGKQKAIKMHRELLSVTDPEIEVDHIDHHGLNNRRFNLRECIKLQNSKNRRGYGVSKFLGVQFYKQFNKWGASIQHNKIREHLGVYLTETEAAQAYDVAAKMYHGEFANLNFK